MRVSKEPILKSLEIAGFKSFGSRKKIQFGSGITAIVGPNGSGKSNVADAVRWVLGEQRTSRLRGNKAEELIFHGTDSKAQASMAEVALVFDNSGKQFATVGNEIEISRQLLRSGESDYRLNGKKTSYAQVEELLAQAGIGKNSYAVISQGTIDQLLTVSGKERKMLFDEAAGVRQFDIRRMAAKRKLETAKADLEKVSLVIDELLPSQKLLQKQADIIKAKKSLEDKLQRLQIDYYRYWQQKHTDRKSILNERISSQELALQNLEHKIVDTRKKSQSSDTDEFLEELRNKEQELSSFETKKNKLQSEITLLEAEQTNISSSESNQNLSQIAKLKLEITKQEKLIQKAKKNASLQNNAVEKFEESIGLLNSKLKAISEKLNESRRLLEKSQRKEFLHHANGLITTVRTQLRNATPRPEIDATMNRLTQMIEVALQDNAAEVALSIGKLQNQISSIMAEREELVEVQTQVVIKMRSLELDILASENTLLSLNSQLAQEQKISDQKLVEKNKSQTLKKSITQKNNELTQLSSLTIELQKTIHAIQEKMSKSQNSSSFDEFEKLVNQQKSTEIILHQHTHELTATEEKLDELGTRAKVWFGKKIPSSGSSLKKEVNLSEIIHLESELEMIAQIDTSTLEQTTEINDRLVFLQTQQKDLMHAIADSEEFISKLEKDTKQRFLKNFAKINEEFERFFVQLFGGGTAKLSLSTKEEFGIEIITTPPKKRTQSVSSLSGGEKSLASVALLAAILACNPSPFIFLDEVDAALDDKNSTRFNAILKNLSKKSQIIVISHNHETMQAASHLYGITASQKGDSEVLHLHLQQADEMASQIRAPKPVDKVRSFK